MERVGRKCTIEDMIEGDRYLTFLLISQKKNICQTQFWSTFRRYGKIKEVFLAMKRNRWGEDMVFSDTLVYKIHITWRRSKIRFA